MKEQNPPFGRIFLSISSYLDILSKISGIGIISILCYLLILTSCVCAIGIGVDPAKLEVEIESGGNTSENITISNPENIEFGFHIYTDDEFTDWITISDPVFSLGPYQKKQVTIYFTPITDKSEKYNATIYAVALDSTSNINIGSGVKIPTYITINKAANSFYTNPVFIILTLVALVIILVSIAFLRKSR
ncbi:MAG: hypothetical protein U9P81_01540 [Euryarchaeota archaeon]|nr:hypothetical protein [Euryarchaeota archaeon]